MLKHLLIVFAVSIFATTSFAQSSSSGSASTMISGLTSLAAGATLVSNNVGPCSGNPSSKQADSSAHLTTFQQGTACLMTVIGAATVVMSATALTGDGSTNSDVSNADSSGLSDNGSQSTGTGATTTGGLGNGAAVTAANNALQAAAAQGYTYNPADGTVTTPTGTYPMGAMGSGQSMAAAGAINPNDIAAVNAQLAALNDKLKVTSMPLAGGAGGGASAAKVKFDIVDDAASGGRGKFRGLAGKTDGLTRSLASGESIGAKVDDIFAMIHRVYLRESNDKVFVGQ